MLSKCYGLLCFLFMTCWQSVAALPAREVTYSWPKSMQTDKRGDYPVALLHLALEKSSTNIVAKPSNYVMSQFRTLKQLELNQGIDVVWTMTNPEREEQLHAIRIPMDRGLIGYRLLVINDEDSERFETLPHAANLKQMLTVQGLDWPDFTILQANGFQLTSSNNFSGMYPMLKKHRVQFFPRSITEVWPELAQQQGQGLIVSPRWALHYPAALYFFVRHRDTELAAAIEQGLETALKDGSFKALFLEHFQEAITKADLRNRQIVELTNPTLPLRTPLKRPELWFDAKQGF